MPAVAMVPVALAWRLALSLSRRDGAAPRCGPVTPASVSPSTLVDIRFDSNAFKSPPLPCAEEDAMANYRIERDDADRLLVCRITGFIGDDAIHDLARDWSAEVARARALYPVLKVMFDNSGGFVMSPKAAAVMAEATRDLRRPDDRRAVLTANSLCKLQAKRTMSAGGEVFISEKAARLWLNAQDVPRVALSD
jgi:hypothetical protein